ncbi:hypothetical protein DRW07_09080 [Alteromonas sediminis]|uniref:Uncharacterized protein n=1 Tax=Alteromonas sediminis TaxID=2259342 RepID=A0A3N5XZT8_9ALTE|nr:tetratricopeptide repeat protein [Alteromonas sediminis]RPJ66240.1 hypothetical protein DRW07_09080 [Alteromonas sediminis]
MKWMLFFILLLIELGFPSFSYANSEGEDRYPTEYWHQYPSPEQAGFISGRLAKVEKFYNKREFASLLIIKHGAIAVDWGENSRRFLVHSIRKSMLSALYGVHSSDIDFHKTLLELDIDDNNTLTKKERSATLLNVISSRSGVYLPAAAEGGQMMSGRPKRGSHAPGSHWWYNNWDFNVAGSAYTNMAKIYIAQENIDGAKKMLDQALHFEPRHKQANNLVQTLAIKEWLLPGIALVIGVLALIIFVVLRKRSS